VRKIVDCASLYTDPDDPWIAEVFDVCAPFLDGRPAPRTITRMARPVCAQSTLILASLMIFSDLIMSSRM